MGNDEIAIVFGASGGIGGALLRAVETSGRHAAVLGFGRASDPSLDLLDEATIERMARHLASLGGPVTLAIDATGFLHGNGFAPEKSWRQIDPVHMARAFAINAIGPALLMKHVLPLLPRDRRAVFATLSARVGSIGDNRTGGWYAYRASKAALNQIVRTAAIELARSRPQAVCVALHPGTVRTALSEPFAKAGLNVRDPDEAAADLLRVLNGVGPEQSGLLLDHAGAVVPW